MLSRDELRKLYVDKVWGTIVAVTCTGALALIVSEPLRRWTWDRAADLLQWCGRGVMVPGWTLAALVFCTTWAGGSWLYRLHRSLRPADVRLFRSLSRDERQVMRLLAAGHFSLMEGELCELLPVPPQVFLHLIDRLVTDLQLAERHEPEGGGAVWALTAAGRKVAVANRLFARQATLE